MAKGKYLEELVNMCAVIAVNHPDSKFQELKLDPEIEWLGGYVYDSNIKISSCSPADEISFITIWDRNREIVLRGSVFYDIYEEPGEASEQVEIISYKQGNGIGEWEEDIKILYRDIN